jgi:hypothetical protein
VTTPLRRSATRIPADPVDHRSNERDRGAPAAWPHSMAGRAPPSRLRFWPHEPASGPAEAFRQRYDGCMRVLEPQAPGFSGRCRGGVESVSSCIAGRSSGLGHGS